jgi:2-hydroxychromene-2-carboxylate isomerase
MTKLEFFFDCSSPWTYLAFTNIQPLAARYGVEITWRPFLVGGVFNTINDSVYQSRQNPVPAKVAYGKKDMKDWARLAGIRITHPPSIFPINSVKAMWGCFVADEAGLLVPFATRVFEAYWGDDENIAEDEVLARLCDDVGLDKSLFFDGIALQQIKDRLRNNTQELIDRGGFGSPTIYINETDMYFGNDRLVLMEDALERLA